MESVIANLAVNHPWILTALAFIGAFRVVFKPLVGIVEKFVKETPGTEDDLILEKVEASKTFKTVCWLIDFLASVKVGTQKTP